MSIVIIGCGNLLRGDDGVGPILIRHLWEAGIPEHVRLVDGGTAGMDVAFQMRGADEVILIDACRSDSPPGTLFKVPGAELENLPPLSEIHSHAFRWDHALAFGRWLLKEDYPKHITVYLIEVSDIRPGMELSAPVEQQMHRLVQHLLDYVKAPV
jgi:hydrogenase maturation protease